MKHRIIIPRAGIASGEQRVRAIYNPATAPMFEALGESELRRASHVEPGSELKEAAISWLCDAGVIEPSASGPSTSWGYRVKQTKQNIRKKWWADLLPVGGPVLGPFDTNTEALDAEVNWLKEHNIPICQPCRDTAVQEILEGNDVNNTTERPGQHPGSH